MSTAYKLRQSQWFRNHHSNCIGTHDAHCTAIGLQCGNRHCGALSAMRRTMA
jgi:hypothetical protein